MFAVTAPLATPCTSTDVAVTQPDEQGTQLDQATSTKFAPRLSNVPPPPTTATADLHETLCAWLKTIHVHDNKVQAVAEVLIRRGYDRLQFMVRGMVTQ